MAKTGVFLALEPYWEALIRPRSGNVLKLGLTVLNTPGTIDAGYRNEIGVILYNSGKDNIILEKDTRIAQMAIREIPRYTLHHIKFEEFSTNTERGLCGFGSSGTK